MSSALRRAASAALTTALLLCVLPLAGASERTRCTRCEHRYTPSAVERKASSRTKECRVCRVQQADGMRAYFPFIKTDEERTERRADWDAHRAALRGDGYEIGEITGTEPPVLKPLATRTALKQALADEALRFRRIATWSRELATKYESRRGTAMRAFAKKDKWGRWAYADLIRACKARVALHTAMAKRYTLLAEDPSGSGITEPLPVADRPERPEREFEGAGATRVAVEIQSALRNLIVMERDAFVRLLAVTRGAKDAKPLDKGELKFVEKFASSGLSTSIVSVLFSRTTAEVEGMTLLKLRLNEDGPLAGFFQRAPVIGAALRREARARAAK